MSPSSRLLVVGLFAAALLLAAGSLAAQDIPATAILEVGPEWRRGIDALAPDVTPYWYGRYRVGAADVELIYVENPLSEPAAWPLAPCPQRQLRAADGLTYYENPVGWSLLVRNAGGELPAGVTLCVFVDRFVDRHLLFENLERVTIPGSAPAFPAVIEL